MWALFLRAEAARFGWSLAKLAGAVVLGGVFLLGGMGLFAGGATVLIVNGTSRAAGAAALGLATQPGATTGAIVSLGGTLATIQAAAAQSSCNVPWPIVAGVAKVEDSSYGAVRAIGSAIAQGGRTIHAYGPAQFLIQTWNSYGDELIQQQFANNAELPPPPEARIWQPASAYRALSNYLCALGVATDPIRALWAYSGCVPGPGCGRRDNYALDVMAIAASYASVPVQPAPTGSPVADRLLAEARTWLGTKYVFGGGGRAGIDCSAFMQVIYATVGVQLPRTTQLEWNATVARGMGVATPQPGDLAFFRDTYYDPEQTITHVGTVSRVDYTTGAVWIIHAPGARAAGDPPDMPLGQVREEQIAGFLAAHLSGYARVLPSPPASNQA